MEYRSGCETNVRWIKSMVSMSSVMWRYGERLGGWDGGIDGGGGWEGVLYCGHVKNDGRIST